MLFKHYTEYVKETVGARFKLSLWQRLRLLFCREIRVVFFYKRGGEDK